jgi:ATP-dependent exoDNAse (exonuclease V) beta subunit
MLYTRPSISGDRPSRSAIVAAYRDGPAPPIPQFVPEWTASALEAVHSSRSKVLTELPALACDSALTDEELEAAFGTLCHSRLQSMFSGLPAGTHIPRVFEDRLTPDVIQSIQAEARKLCDAYMDSPSAAIFHRSDSAESEVPFLMRYGRGRNTAFISGVIDLLIRRGDSLTIVDFKTDKVIRDGEYYLQLSIYREAAKAWTDKTVTCYLVYLRGNHIVEVPESPLPDLFDIALNAGL